MIGIDTTGLIDLFRNDKNILKLLEETEEEIILNIITYLELMLGLDFRNLKHKNEESFYDNLYNQYNVLKLDYKSSKKNSEINRELKNKGKIIDPFDMTIAAIYLTNGINKIITRNVKHFENIKDIEVIKY